MSNSNYNFRFLLLSFIIGLMSGGAILYFMLKPRTSPSSIGDQLGFVNSQGNSQGYDQKVAASIQELQQLQQLDESFSSKLTDSLTKDELDTLNSRIIVKENSLKESISFLLNDEFSKKEMSQDSRLLNLARLLELISQTRRSLTIMRYGLLAGNMDLTADEQAWMKLNAELRDKSLTISRLEADLQKRQMIQNTGETPAGSSDIDDELAIQLREKNQELLKTIEVLQQQNKAVKATLEEEKRNSAGNSGKALDLSKRISALEADLIFANIDCSLLRADSKQLVTNSVQRKELLSEALKDLSRLYSADDAAIKEKAKTKMQQVQRISAIVRD